MGSYTDSIREQQHGGVVSEQQRALDYTRLAYPAEREEIISSAMLQAMGAETNDAHPYGHFVADYGLGLGDLKVLMGANFASSGELASMLGRTFKIVSDQAAAAYTPEHDGLLTVHPVDNYQETEIGRVLTVDAGEIGENASQPSGDPGTGPLVTHTAVGLRDYGVHFLLTRELQVNGDWELVSAMLDEGVRAYYRRERAALVAALENNSALSDGTAVFDSSRGNDLTGATGMDAAALGLMRAGLRELQTSGGDDLNYRGGILAVPSGYEQAARGLLADETLPGQDPMALFVDSRLSYFYLLPPKKEVPVLHVAALEGVRAPVVDVLSPSAMFDDSDPRAHRDGLYLRVWGPHDVKVTSPAAVRMATP